MSLAVPPVSDFPVLAREGLVYLDSAATSQTPRHVIEAMDRYYNEYRGSIHRGVYPLAVEATEAYEGAREKVAAFTGSTAGETVFTRNGTESINLVAYSWGRANVGPDDLVVLTQMEHHSNIVPWQMLGCELAWVPVDDDGLLDLDALDAALARGPKLVAVAHVSNVLGTVNPIAEITRRAHAAGAIVVVDGMQAVPHMPVDVGALDADFYAWTGHKAYGPTGIGVLHGRRALLEEMPPFLGGGHMISRVTEEGFTSADRPPSSRPARCRSPRRSGSAPPSTSFGHRHGRGLGALARRRRLRRRAAARGARAHALRAVGRRPPRQRRSVRDRGSPSARRGRDHRPRRCLRTRRPPLRPAADAPPRRVGDEPRIVRRALHARGGRSLDRRPRHRPRRVLPRLMDDLYRENILQHYKAPHHWGELPDADFEAEDLNPLCGDELKVQLKVDGDGKIEDVRFSGHGCAISQASASMTSDEIVGMPVDELLEARPRRSCSTCWGSTSRPRA